MPYHSYVMRDHAPPFRCRASMKQRFFHGKRLHWIKPIRSLLEISAFLLAVSAYIVALVLMA